MNWITKAVVTRLSRYAARLQLLGTHSNRPDMEARPNTDVRRLTVHVAISSLATALSSVFSVVFLVRAGLTPTQIFLATAAFFVVRLITRPIVLAVAPIMGVRRALIWGVVFTAVSCPMLAPVNGVGFALAAYIAVGALGQAFYWTCFHIFFSAHSDSERRGSQLGFLQMLGALAAVIGPAIGGVLLDSVRAVGCFWDRGLGLTAIRVAAPAYRRASYSARSTGRRLRGGKERRDALFRRWLDTNQPDSLVHRDVLCAWRALRQFRRNVVAGGTCWRRGRDGARAAHRQRTRAAERFGSTLLSWRLVLCFAPSRSATPAP